MKYSVCIEMLFHEAMFEDRIRLAKEAGFSAVEFWCWWEHDMEAITGVCRSEGMLISNICTRFIPLTDLGQADDYIAGLIETLEAAKRLGCLNIVSHIGSDTGESRERQLNHIEETLRRCIPYLEEAGRTLLLEPVNRGEIPNYFAPYSDEVGAIIRKTGSPSVRMLFDIYHQQLSEGNIINHLRRNIDVIGHIHAAGVPERAELDYSEVDYKRIIRELGALGYDKYIGLEYMPREKTVDGLSRLPILK